MMTNEMKSRYDEAKCLVPMGTMMEGSVETDQPMVLLIEGHFKGSIKISEGGTVIIAAKAEVDAEAIEADDIVIEGLLTGEVHARQGLFLSRTSRMRGTAKYGRTVAVEPNARISGQLRDTSWTDHN